jgi:putative addiction module killer protein
MYTLIRSTEFDAWLETLAGSKAYARILTRLDSASLGNFGDCKPVGEGISEMRIHAGAGYRIYYMRTAIAVYLLLTGGDKSSQSKDIVRAKKMARNIKET